MPAGPDLSVVIIVLITFIAPAIPVLIIGMVYYHKKKLEQQQILAAIEKGVPVAELNIGAKKPTKNGGAGWIKDQSKGITLLVIGIGIGIAFMQFLVFGRKPEPIMHIMWIVPVVFLGNGVGLLIRARMRWKYEKPESAKEITR